MKRDNYYNYIDEQLHILAHRIISNGKLNILRLHLHSENFYLHFFNLLYGYNLINLNDVSQNIEAIDLIDHDKKIMIQVSSTSTKQKIESALSKNILKEYAGYRFKFISIAKDASDLRKKEYKNPHAVTFNPSEDIYDIHSLLNTILSLDLDKLKEVYNFIQKELGEGSKNRFDSTILKEKYLNNFKTISLLTNTSKPINDIEEFINLAIIKEEEKKKDNPKLINKEPILSSYEEIYKPKEPIAIEELINISKKSLIYGKAGIGKTTLCKYIAYTWAKEELYQEFEYVIYIALREWKTKGLKGAIKDNYYSQDEEKITLDIKANNSKMLFLFDGYDELEGDKKKILRDEIEHYNLNHYIITTRPYGYQKSDFRVDEYFETIGFTDEDVEKYIDAFFRENNDKAKSLKAYLETNINIKHIGYIPLMLEMICLQWEQKEFSESLTMTELYSHVVEDILNQYSAQKDDIRVYKRKNRKKIKEQLGKLAFRGLTKQTIFFDGDFIEESVDDIFFEENVIYSGFLKSDAKEKDLLDNCFEFLHLTFQEYFSALYVSTLSKEEQSKIIRDWKFYPHMQMFFAFLGGLIEDKEFLLGEIESEPKDLVGVYSLNLILFISNEFKHFTLNIKEKILKCLSKFLIYSYKIDKNIFYKKFNSEQIIRTKIFNDKEFFSILKKYEVEEKLLERIDSSIKSSKKDFEFTLQARAKYRNKKETFSLIDNNKEQQQKLMKGIFKRFSKDNNINKSIKELLTKSLLENKIEINEKNIDIIIHILKTKPFWNTKQYGSINRRIYYEYVSDYELIVELLLSFDRTDDKIIDTLLFVIEDSDFIEGDKLKCYMYITRNIININKKYIDKIIELIQEKYLYEDVRLFLIPPLKPIIERDSEVFDKFIMILEKKRKSGLDRTVDIKIIQTLLDLDINDDKILKVLKNNIFNREVPTINTDITNRIILPLYFKLYDLKYDIIKFMIFSIFYNEKPIYLKNNKLHTIENGKEISTQREVDEATLNEIKMMFRGEGLNG